MRAYIPVLVGLLIMTACTAQRAPESPYLTPTVSRPISPPIQSRPTPPKATQPHQPKSVQRKGPVVFIDPGHGGHDVGAMYSPRKLQEKRLTLDIARRVERCLVEKGFCVCLSRSKDVAVTLERRVQLAQQVSAAVFISIHLNSSPKRNTSGAEVFYRGPALRKTRTAVASRKLGGAILNSLCRTLPTGNRGVKNGNFYVIRETTMPSVLVEAAFMTNPQDALLLSSPSYRQRIALAVAKGVEEYFSTSSRVSSR